MKNYLFLSLFCLSFSLHADAQIITTVAGDSLIGYCCDSILATSASLDDPIGIALDKKGNLYIADRNNSQIRMVNTDGIIINIAGTGAAGYNGDSIPATSAKLNRPYGIATDTIGNIYFCDDGNFRVRKIDTFGIITTIAGTGTAGYNGDSIPAIAAEISGIAGTATDKYGNVYFSDGDNNRVRKINSAGIITTVAGTGLYLYNGDNIPAIAANINTPYGVTVDRNGNIYIGEENGNRVRKVDTTGIISTIAGNGHLGYNGDNINADSAELDQPVGITVDDQGIAYIADAYNFRLRKVTTDGIITTIAGTGAPGYNGDNIPATLAEIGLPVSTAIDPAGNIYIADFGNSRIRKITSTERVYPIPNATTGITVYPNPLVDYATFVASNPNGENRCLTIFNEQGQAVQQYNFASSTARIERKGLPAGFYYYQLRGANNGIANGKLLIS